MKFSIKRTSGKKVPQKTKTFKTLEELLEFVNEAGECIIWTDGVNGCLEIYDDYRE